MVTSFVIPASSLHLTRIFLRCWCAMWVSPLVRWCLICWWFALPTCLPCGNCHLPHDKEPTCTVLFIFGVSGVVGRKHDRTHGPKLVSVGQQAPAPTEIWEPGGANLELRLPCSGKHVLNSSRLSGTPSLTFRSKLETLARRAEALLVGQL